MNKIASKWRNNSVECVCKNGFTGELCNETNDVCETMEPCKNGGLCQPLAGDGGLSFSYINAILTDRILYYIGIKM